MIKRLFVCICLSYGVVLLSASSSSVSSEVQSLPRLKEAYSIFNIQIHRNNATLIGVLNWYEDHSCCFCSIKNSPFENFGSYRWLSFSSKSGGEKIFKDVVAVKVVQPKYLSMNSGYGNLETAARAITVHEDGIVRFWELSGDSLCFLASVNPFPGATAKKG